LFVGNRLQEERIRRIVLGNEGPTMSAVTECVILILDKPDYHVPMIPPRGTPNS
jgi:hypothetical protein